MLRRPVSSRSLDDATCKIKRRQRFQTDGVVIVEYALGDADLSALDQVAARWMPRGGGCEVLGEDWDFVSRHRGLHDLACSLIQKPLMLLRGVCFEEAASANWFEPWHQDRSRAVRWGVDKAISPMDHRLLDKMREQGARKWGEFLPDVLSQLVSLQVHLDDCGEDDGPIEVALGSHVYGALRREAVGRRVARSKTGLCLARRGDIVAMSPFLLRRSQRAKSPTCRRKMLHLDYVLRATRERDGGRTPVRLAG